MAQPCAAAHVARLSRLNAMVLHGVRDVSKQLQARNADCPFCASIHAPFLQVSHKAVAVSVQYPAMTVLHAPHTVFPAQPVLVPLHLYSQLLATQQLRLQTLINNPPHPSPPPVRTQCHTALPSVLSLSATASHAAFSTPASTVSSQ